MKVNSQSDQNKITSPLHSNTKRIFSWKEKLLLFLALPIFFLSTLFWAIDYYLSSTVAVPTLGGEYTEGLLGRPLYINPVLAQTNEIDTIISSLIFSSLYKYNDKGELEKDLATEQSISEDKKTYNLKIRDDAYWHDGEKLTAQDIFFTIKIIQNPAFKSPLRGDWQDISVTTENDTTLNFQLKEPSSSFPNKLTFGILPRHIFEQIPADNFLSSEFNLKPVGSGPFVFFNLQKDKEESLSFYQLVRNENYYGQKAYLEKINFSFYPNEDSLLEAYKEKAINGLGLISQDKLEQLKNRKDTQIFALDTPRYFAVFLNPNKSKPLADKNVRQALNYATDRQTIIDKIFLGYAQKIQSPILDAFAIPSVVKDKELKFDPEKASSLLDENGWKKGADGWRGKENTPLEINLITTQWPALAATAEELKSQWEKIGVKVNLTNLTISEIQQNFIKPREYDALLFGQEYAAGNEPDFLLYWHSKWKKDPGGNLALFDNKKADEALEKIRTATSLEERKEAYQKFEEAVWEETPAIFLYSPRYLFILNKKIHGFENSVLINPALRLASSNKWYIKTERIKK